MLVFPEAFSCPNFVLRRFCSNLRLCYLLLFQSKRFCLQLCILFLSNKGCFCLRLCHTNLFLFCSLYCTFITSWLISSISLNMSLSSENYLFTFISFWSEYNKSSISLELLVIFETRLVLFWLKTVFLYSLPLSVILL